MIEMKAVYWPTWRVDIVLEGEVESRGKSWSGGKASLKIREAYIPGKLEGNRG
jgi:hypothetical protein